MILQDDLDEIELLGRKNGGRSDKVKHRPTARYLVQKSVPFDPDGPGQSKKIIEDLKAMAKFRCKYLLDFYQANFAASVSTTFIYVEYMDKGSFESIYKRVGPIPADVLGQVSVAVVEGMSYLHEDHGIIPRNIKPSNILCNSQGAIKIGDFVVSEELINSIPETFVSTSFYVSPERIQGAPYTIKADVWSLGISLVEMALAKFPFVEAHTKTGVTLDGDESTMGIIELLKCIIEEPSPSLTPEEKYPKHAHQLVRVCLMKNPDDRPDPKTLLTHDWIAMSRDSIFDMKDWVAKL